MKKNLSIYIAFLLLFSLNIYAQSPVKMNLDTKIDSLGTAHVNMSMELNASQWESFKNNMGNNATQIMKRQIEQVEFPSFYIDKFNFNQDETNRKCNLTFDIPGFCTINPNGLWQINGDESNPDIMKITDKEYMVTSDQDNNGIVEHEVEKITFPINASDIKQDKDAFGKPIFTYSLNGSGGMHGKLLFLISGILLLIVGGAFFFIPSKKQITV